MKRHTRPLFNPCRQRTVAGARPLITLTTDFGLEDTYVAQMKAALLARCRNAQLIDVTHSIGPHDIAGGSIALERAVTAFPSKTLHVAVVDPGVGTHRRMLVAQVKRSLVICPDNGLITWTHRRHGVAKFFELTWRPDEFSNTFHGRDVTAPAAAMLAASGALASIARPLSDPVLLDLDIVQPQASEGVIIHIDHYGNATTNFTANHLAGSHATIQAAGHSIGKLSRTYADVPAGEPLALLGSSGLLEIAVRGGSASNLLGLRVGDQVELL